MATARDELAKRQLPEMQMSDGTANSMTPPTRPLPDNLSAEQKALARFAVQGNAIITGGAGNLALHAARAMLEHGLSGLALVDLNTQSADTAIEKLKDDFPKAHVITADVNVTSSEAVGRVFTDIAFELGSVDVLACFAGVVGCTHALDMSEQEWRKLLDVNTTGEFICAQAAGRLMQAQGTGGSIVLIASISGHRVNFPQPQVAYNVSKTAVLHLARSLAAEWARYGIRVNTISPGYMDTILNEGEGLAKARAKWAERNPMGRMGSPPELTGPLIMLCSKYAGAYINGADIVVDGGGIVF